MSGGEIRSPLGFMLTFSPSRRKGSVMSVDQLKGLSREKLEGMLVDSAKNWLAHDGLWFQAAEKEHGKDASGKNKRPLRLPKVHRPQT